MAKVHVEARSTILDLRRGQRSEVERTPLIDALIEAGKLVEVTKDGKPKATSTAPPKGSKGAKDDADAGDGAEGTAT